MSFFIQDAAAETAPTATTSADLTAAGISPEGNIMTTIAPFIFIFIIFYFLLIRPQQRKMKLHQAMIANIRRGDKVITAGGILGKVAKVNQADGTLDVEIADDITIQVVASTISSVIVDKPVNDNAKTKGSKK